MKADLHVHSTASDGTLAPAELVGLALARGLSVLAIADHDSVEGLPQALQAAKNTRLTVVPAVELSAATAEGHDVHILGYFIDAADADFLEHLVRQRGARMQRAERMVEALSSAGYGVTIADVLAMADGAAVGRSHIARALVSSGHAQDVRDAFDTLIGRGRPFYVPKDALSPAEVIAVILDAGGIPVLAHPAISMVEGLVPELVPAGLRGLEAYHADHTPEQRNRIAALAAEYGLLVTGGSDFHGPKAPNPPLGSVDVPGTAVRALLAAGRA